MKMICLPALLLLSMITVAHAGESNQVTGSVTYLERIALPPTARVEIKLLDVSLQDVVAKTISEQTISLTRQVPINFELVYDPAVIDERYSYVVRATIYDGDKMLFTTDRAYPVLTRDASSQVDLILKKVGQ